MNNPYDEIFGSEPAPLPHVESANTPISTYTFENMNQQMNTVAAQAAISQTSVTKALVTAVTGDACADLMAVIRHACDDSGLSAQQCQFILECYAALYKDTADQYDRSEEYSSTKRKLSELEGRLKAEQMKLTSWATDGTEAATSPSLAPFYEELRQRTLEKVKADYTSGTHSPLTKRPVSTGGSVEPCPPPESFSDFPGPGGSAESPFGPDGLG